MSCQILGFFYPIEGLKEGDNMVRVIFRILYSTACPKQTERCADIAALKQSRVAH